MRQYSFFVAVQQRKSKSQPAAESWIYDDVDGAQRGTVEIDSESQKVRAVMIIPRELESEFKVSYLLEKKFKDSSFEKMPLQICSDNRQGCKRNQRED